jgi:hypothetical protein
VRAGAIACAAVLLAACGDDACPAPREPVGIESGELQSDGGEALVQCQTCPVKAFPPHDLVSPIGMTIDADDGRLILRYQRDGKQIEEVWRIGERSEL